MKKVLAAFILPMVFAASYVMAQDTQNKNTNAFWSPEACPECVPEKIYIIEQVEVEVEVPKPIVVPLNSNRASGVDGQVQYNDAGREAASEIYYRKATGNVGIGNVSPSEVLEVNGNVKANSFIGDGSQLKGIGAAESDPTVPAGIKDGITWSEVSNRPSGLDDGDDNTQLSETEVDNYVSNNGFLTTETDPNVLPSVKDGVSWSEVSAIPAGFADNVDDNTQLSETQVDNFVSNNGYLTSESDPEVGTNATNYVPKWDGTSLVQGSIFDDGNVGIGIETPADPLHIVADAEGDNIHLEEPAGDNGEDWQIGVDGSGNLNFKDSGTRRVSFQDNSGRMFIGEGTPEYLATGLHVETADSAQNMSAFPNYDELVLENTGNVGLSFLTNAAVGGIAFGGESQHNCDSGNMATYGQDCVVGPDSLISLVYYEYFNKEIGFYVDNAVRMVIESTGEVGIGTQAPAYQLELTTDSAGKLSTNTWVVTSDERIKTNINDFNDGLDVIMQIRPVTYEYNGLAGHVEDGKMKVGIIAQELEPVAPYMIGRVKKKLYPEDEEETELLDYQGHALAFITVNAIQEQQEQIQVLQVENAMLKEALCSKDNSFSWCLL